MTAPPSGDDWLFETHFLPAEQTKAVIVRPGPKRVAWRALCLNALLFRQALEHETPHDDVVYARLNEWLAKYLTQHLSARERETLAEPLGDWSEGQIIDMSWRTEALGVLLFALDLTRSLPAFDTKIELGLDAVPILEPPDDFVDAPRLRDHDHVDDLHQLAELWLWRMRSRPRKGKAILPMTVREAVQGIDPLMEGDLVAFDKPVFRLNEDEAQTVESIAFERLYAARWLAGTMLLDNESPENELDWDKVSTDT